MIETKFVYYLKNMQNDKTINDNRKTIWLELKKKYHDKITPLIIKTCFEQIDKIWFDSEIEKTIKDLHKNLKFMVSNKLTKTAGYFMFSHNYFIFKISSVILENLFKKGVKTVKISGIEASDVLYVLIILMEHEITHLLISSLLKNHHLNPPKEKSGHTSTFKILVYNMYHHLKVTHDLLLGDVSEFETKIKQIKSELTLGDYIRCLSKKYEGIVVDIKNKYVVIKSNSSYKSCLLNDIEIVKKAENSISDLYKKYKIGDIIQIKIGQKMMNLRILKMEKKYLLAEDLVNHKKFKLKIWVLF
jgi:hypothetical protein